MGVRQCPNPQCRLYVFTVAKGTTAIRSYPPETIDFDSSKIPSKVVAALEEAIKCHAASCYRAAAMMVRKALEELCEENDAKGPRLVDRIKALKEKAVIPPTLMEGLDEIRLLGNDAAHIIAKDYDDIGKPHVEAAIEFTKEVLKAVYQYQSLVQKLQLLKNSPANPTTA